MAAELIDSEDIGVSSVELFFDLVFVFAITQLTGLLAAEPNALGLARVVVILGNLWWMYGGYAWLTNVVPPRAPRLRAMLLLGMAGFFVVALAIPGAFGSTGVAFGIGYLAVVTVHTAMFMLSTQQGVLRVMLRLGPSNLLTAGVLLAAGFTHGALQWALWTGAFAWHWSSPFVSGVSRVHIRARHFVERHGLIVLIALGESVVAVGIGVRATDLDVRLAVTALLGLVLAAELWWLYFDGDDERAEATLGAADPQRAPWLALYGFGHGFLPILAGILVFAAGVKRATGHFSAPATTATAWFIAGGVATYLLGMAWFRVLFRAGTARVRVVVAVLALPAAVLGVHTSTAAELALLVAVVGAGIAVETVLRARLAGRE